MNEAVRKAVTDALIELNIGNSMERLDKQISTGHVFHFFKLIFSVVTSFVLLSEGKISKKEKEKVEISKKTTIAQKTEKKERGERGIIFRGAYREDQSELC